MIPSDHPLAERVLGLIPINGLDPRLHSDVLSQGELIEYRRKKVVFKEGERDQYTVYLVSGELELRTGQESPHKITADEDSARRALAQLQPRRYTARTVTDSVVFRIERAVLDHILSDEQVGDELGSIQVEEEEDDEADWMTRLLTSPLFTRLPHDNIQRFFAELEPVPMEAGDLMVEQGTEGDALFIVAEGLCSVVRESPGGGEQQLAVLKEGDAFGEESLISNSPRNASVRAVAPGFLMKLAKPAFEELVSKPTLKSVPYSEACSLVEGGARWLDVRFDEERDNAPVPDSVNIPLGSLRVQAPNLDKDTSYVVCCDTGARSSTGAFLLARLGIESYYLAGGLMRTPLAEGGSTPAPAPVEAPAEEAPPETTEEAPSTPAPAAAPTEAADTPPTEAPEVGVDVMSEVANEALEQERARHARESGELKRRLEALTRERDEIIAKGRKAADTARELKRRYDELLRAAQGERTQREQLQKTLEHERAEATRKLEMETARLEGELEKGRARQAEAESAQSTAAEGLRAELEADRTRLAAATARIEELERASAESEAARAQAESQRAAAEAEQAEQLENARKELAKATARAEEAERERGALDARVADLEAAVEAAARRSEAEDSENQELTEAAREALDADRAKLEADRSKLEAERARLDAEREALAGERTALEREREDFTQSATESEATRRALEESLSARQVALESATETMQRRMEELDQREQDLEQARGAVDEELGRREESLARAEAALREEQSQWEGKVEEAVAQQRGELEREAESVAAARAEIETREQALETARETQETELAEREEELAGARAALEAERAEGESRLEEALGEERARMAEAVARLKAQAAESVKRGAEQLARQQIDGLRQRYEQKLAEQEAMLEDERQRVEAETVRLREALAQSRRRVEALEASAKSRPAAAEPEVPEFISVPGHEEPAEESSSGADWYQPEAEAETESAEPAESASETERDRVLSPAQLAELRRKMQEKIKQASAG